MAWTTCCGQLPATGSSSCLKRSWNSVVFKRWGLSVYSGIFYNFMSTLVSLINEFFIKLLIKSNNWYPQLIFSYASIRNGLKILYNKTYLLSELVQWTISKVSKRINLWEYLLIRNLIEFCIEIINRSFHTFSECFIRSVFCLLGLTNKIIYN